MKKVISLFAFTALFALSVSSALASPIVGTFTSNTLPANDDGSTGSVALGFNFNFFGTVYSNAFVNNNGNITFNSPLGIFTPFGLTGSIGTPIIAPFFADVDTRVGNVVTYGTGTFDGHAAFGVEWPGVGYYAEHTDKLDTFELILVDRSDIAPGDADFYFNYGSMQWETGDASGGNGGLGGDCAITGYSNGTGDPGTNFEVPGAGVCGALIDGGANQLMSATNDGTPGQYLFEVRSGVVTTPTPEPATLALIGFGLVGLVAMRRKFAK